MFTIELKIGDTMVRRYSAVRVWGKDNEVCGYKLGDGTIIQHHYNDGAEALATKILMHYISNHYDDIATHKPKPNSYFNPYPAREVEVDDQT